MSRLTDAARPTGDGFNAKWEIRQKANEFEKIKPD
jgi:hypothetical protein